MKEKIMKFMYGRYGNDELNQFLVKLIFVNLILSLFVRSSRFLSDLFYYLSIILLIFMYYRMFSKNYSKRYSEKMAYLEYSNKVKVYLDKNNKDKSQRKEFRFYKCPSCKQKVRVPRGKGKISIHCPKCGVDFIKKS
ncbi:MAG: hypothetical protein Q3980_07385 [Turicibacter sp.]|nr:hypothetical protein [Turicibacter sp.]